MSTNKQKTADRRNARRSTGPRDTRRTRYNALSPILPHEDHAALIDEYQPANMHEFQLIDHIAHAQIRMERSRRFEKSIFDLQFHHAKSVKKQPARLKKEAAKTEQIAATAVDSISQIPELASFGEFLKPPDAQPLFFAPLRLCGE